MEAINNAASVIAILATDGVVIAAEKKVTGKLLDLSLSKGGGGENGGDSAWAAGGEKIFLLNKSVHNQPSRKRTGGGLVGREGSVRTMGDEPVEGGKEGELVSSATEPPSTMGLVQPSTSGHAVRTLLAAGYLISVGLSERAGEHSPDRSDLARSSSPSPPLRTPS